MVSARMAGFALLAFCALEASAAAEPGFYFGITIGQAEYDFDELQVPVATLPPGVVPVINPNLPPSSFRLPTNPAFAVNSIAFIAPLAPFGVQGSDYEDDDTSWSALLGYRISRHVAAEVAYTNLGELTSRQTFYPFPTFAPIQSKHTLETQGPTLTLIGILPVGERWEIFVRAGAFFLDSKAESKLGASKISSTYGSEGAIFGAGAQYNAGEHWSVRLDLQRYNHVGDKLDGGEADIDNASLGVIYRL